jgi:hypothetical protein
MGVEMWTKTYGLSLAVSLGTEESRTVFEYSDTGFLVGANTDNNAASTNGDILLIKTDSLGVVEWSKTYGGANTKEYIAAVIEYSVDNGIVICALEYLGGSASNFYTMLIKTDSDGVVEWSKYFGTSTGADYSNYVIEHSIDNGIICMMRSDSFGANFLFMLVKTNGLGVVQWTKVCVCVYVYLCVIPLSLRSFALYVSIPPTLDLWRNWQ